MKSLLAALLFSSFAFAQTQTASAKAPGCGDDNARFDVKTDSAQHLIAQPELGKALIYFLQDDSNFNARPRPTTRFGIDGAWVGATHGDSYFLRRSRSRRASSLRQLGKSRQKRTPVSRDSLSG